ncbi:hypothetical protein PVAP13_5NG105762 [Panicum virgatum]|uniref:Uncharacterized protein n=1 Tax=Panicum virgatum TaxID=38727 RepID=A0A8T0RPR1_PANVG|nr:hypothetical protein PVAP13_5NG105762 [Panicum virgatum]
MARLQQQMRSSWRVDSALPHPRTSRSRPRRRYDPPPPSHRRCPRSGTTQQAEIRRFERHRSPPSAARAAAAHPHSDLRRVARSYRRLPCSTPPRAPPLGTNPRRTQLLAVAAHHRRRPARGFASRRTQLPQTTVNQLQGPSDEPMLQRRNFR